jgi:hypothetical protein
MFTNSATRQSNYKQRVQAIQKYLSGEKSIILAGSTYTPADLMKFYEDWAALVGPVLAAHTQWKEAVVKRDTALHAVEAIDLALRDWLDGRFGRSSTVLADFGLAIAKKAKVGVKIKTQAVAKGAATRAARHTMGKRQKKAVKGAAPASPVASTPSNGTPPIHG